jgi:hypothetical protein
MPVRELLRGLAGALVGLLATLVLLSCLVETRERFGKTERVVAWSGLKSRTTRVSPLWEPLLHYGVFNTIVGYVIGVRLTTKRNFRYAVVGSLIAVTCFLLIPSPLPDEFGRAGENTVWILTLFGAFLGAAGGTLYAERTSRRYRLLDD